MPRTIRPCLTSFLAAVLLYAAGPAVAAPFEEDVAFGVGLVRERFYLLGVEILTPIAEQLRTAEESAKEERAVYDALIKAHTALTRIRYGDPGPEQWAAIQDEHRAAANTYRALRSELGIDAAEDLEGLVEQVARARNLLHEAERDPSEDTRKSVTEEGIRLFESAVAGLDTLTNQATEALDRHYEMEPDSDGSVHDRWALRGQELEEAHLMAGINLNMARFWLSKALPGSRQEQKAQLLEEATVGLDEFVSIYPGWLYTIPGREVLAHAFMDQRRFQEVEETCEPALQLIKDLIREQPSVRDAMRPWRNRLLAKQAIALAMQDKFTSALAKLDEGTDPELEIARAEVFLIQASKLAPERNNERGQELRAQAVEIVNRLADIDADWRHRVEILLDMYSPGGSSYIGALAELERAKAGGDNDAVIRAALTVVAFGDAVPPPKRVAVLKVLAVAYGRADLHYECYVVYHYLASSGVDEESSDHYAERAVRSLDKQVKLSGSSADRALFSKAQKWFRDEYGGPGAEYGRATELKAAKRYAQAIPLFESVAEDSLYHESAVEQAGECYVLRGMEMLATDPAGAAKSIEKGRKTLRRFLEMAGRPSPFPRVAKRRERLSAAAIYRLAASYMIAGQEDYKTVLEITDGFKEKFPDSPIYFHVLYLRVRALVAMDALDAADAELRELRRAVSEMEDKERGQRRVNSASNLLFARLAEATQRLKDEAGELDRQAGESADPQQAEALLAEATSKRLKAVQLAGRALDVIGAALLQDPDPPYGKLLWVIYELDRRNRANDLIQYLTHFLDKFGGRQDLTPEQQEEIADARIMLGIAHYRAGQYDKALAVLEELRKAYEAEHEQQIKQNPEAPYDQAYWKVLLYIGRGAKELVGEDPKHEETALSTFKEIRKRVWHYSDDWWDATLSIAEIYVVVEQYKDALFVIEQLMRADAPLTGEILERVIAIVEDSIEKAPKRRTREDAERMLEKLQALRQPQESTEDAE